jgi:hypothetical protein
MEQDWGRRYEYVLLAGFFGPDLTIVEGFEKGGILSYFEQFLFHGNTGQNLGATLTHIIIKLHSHNYQT